MKCVIQRKHNRIVLNKVLWTFGVLVYEVNTTTSRTKEILSLLRILWCENTKPVYISLFSPPSFGGTPFSFGEYKRV